MPSWKTIVLGFGTATDTSVPVRSCYTEIWPSFINGVVGGTDGCSPSSQTAILLFSLAEMELPGLSVVVGVCVPLPRRVVPQSCVFGFFISAQSSSMEALLMAATLRINRRFCSSATLDWQWRAALAWAQAAVLTYGEWSNDRASLDFLCFPHLCQWEPR